LDDTRTQVPSFSSKMEGYSPDHYTVIEEKEGYKYEVSELLGNGEFGSVFKVKEVSTNSLFAVKLIYGNINNLDIKREIEILLKCRHKNIVRLIEYNKITPKGFLVNLNTDIPSIALVMELCDGNLRSKLEGRNAIDYEWNKSVFLQIIDGVGYLHSQKIIHRDLKPENILYVIRNGEFIVKIGDLSLSKIETNRPTIPSRSVGTYRYMAPELQFGYLSNYRADIFSLGIVLLEMYTVEPPDSWIVSFRGRNMSKLTDIKVNRDILRLALNMTNEDPEDRPQSCERLKEIFTLIT
jgi:serine/threonine protein kinase